jgi:hypothetical protein
MFVVTEYTGSIFLRTLLPGVYLSRNVSEDFYLSSGIQHSVFLWMSTSLFVSGFLLILLFNPENRGKFSLRNVG